MMFLRLVLTTLLTIAAVFGGIHVWETVFRDPWTRDAHVRANLVQVAPQVSGEIAEVAVRNNQAVAKGDVLFRIDDASYRLALAKAQASLATDRAEAANDHQQADRLIAARASNNAAVSEQAAEEARLTAEAADATVQAAEVAVRQARLDLERTTVRAPVDGKVTNLAAHPGDYAATGTAILAMVDTNSFRVDAFFMETKIGRIAVGDRARVRLMANGELLEGRVAGIAPGIAYSEDMSSSLLQAPTPSFQWIRLAQRIPVEIELTTRPARLALANGMTASVIVTPAAEAADAPAD